MGIVIVIIVMVLSVVVVFVSLLRSELVCLLVVGFGFVVFCNGYMLARWLVPRSRRR